MGLVPLLSRSVTQIEEDESLSLTARDAGTIRDPYRQPELHRS
jgi:hypothetical protein